LTNDGNRDIIDKKQDNSNLMKKNVNDNKDSMDEKRYKKIVAALERQSVEIIRDDDMDK